MKIKWSIFFLYTNKINIEMNADEERSSSFYQLRISHTDQFYLSRGIFFLLLIFGNWPSNKQSHSAKFMITNNPKGLSLSIRRRHEVQWLRFAGVNCPNRKSHDFRETCAMCHACYGFTSYQMSKQFWKTV